MKITKETLKHIIEEERQALLLESAAAEQQEDPGHITALNKDPGIAALNRADAEIDKSYQQASKENPGFTGFKKGDPRSEDRYIQSLRTSINNNQAFLGYWKTLKADVQKKNDQAINTAFQQLRYILVEGDGDSWYHFSTVMDNLKKAYIKKVQDDYHGGVAGSLSSSLEENKMKITKETLKRIIKEEREKLLSESSETDTSGPDYRAGTGGRERFPQSDAPPRYTLENAWWGIRNTLERQGYTPQEADDEANNIIKMFKQIRGNLGGEKAKESMVAKTKGHHPRISAVLARITDTES